MNNTQVNVFSQTQLATHIGERTNDTAHTRWSLVQKYQAINAAIQSFSTRVTVPHVYTISGGLVAGTYVYELPSYMEGPIDPEYKQIIGVQSVSTTANRIWSDLTNYTIDPQADGGRELRLSYDPGTTDARIIWWAPNGPIPVAATLPVTSAEISSSATSVTLTTIPLVGQSGFIKIDQEIIFYAGVTVGSATITLNNLVRALSGTTAATHVITSSVDWCVAVHRNDLFEQLMAESIAYLHLINMNDSSQQERAHHESQLLYYKQIADEYWKRYQPGRSSRVRLNRRAVGPGIGETEYERIQIG